jgi:prolyl-tRNA editing enzyme YbaK/EbsC (Cys-tRNA(Pro) deacylase)
MNNLPAPEQSPSVSRVQAFLDRAGLDLRIVELAASTRTSAEAAQAVGCDVAQIAKSLIFRTGSGGPVLVVASGTNRVSEKKVGAVVGEKIFRADPEFVREQTGYAIGGVPPVAHARPVRTIVDRDLLTLPALWAAGGSPHAVFRLLPAELLRLTGGEVADVRAE